MLGNLLTLGILIAAAVFFAWLTRRAWRARRWYVKWPGVILAGLLTLLLVLVSAVGAKGLYSLYGPYPVAAADVAIAGTPEQVARGEHLASVLCASCHSLNGELPLSGGFNLSDDSGLPLGDLYAPNITPAGRIKDFSDEDIWRILRTGVRRDGRLTFMAGVPVSRMSDEDAQAVIAFLRRAQSVQKETPPINPSFLLALFVGAGFIAIDVPSTVVPITAPPKAATVQYGEYLLNFLDCRGCHGPKLAGDAPPPAPPSPNITGIVTKWSKDDFFKAMRTGVDPSGHQIQAPMPWKQIGKLDDVELEALYKYLNGLTPISKP